MFDLHITNVHKFYHVPIYYQKKCRWPGLLTFVIDGLEFQKMTFPDGTIGPTPDPTQPFIQFLKQGTVIDYRFGVNRKCWGFRFDAPKIEYDSRKTHVEILCDNMTLRLPIINSVPSEQVFTLIGKFEKMRGCYLSPTEHNSFKLHHLAYDILYYLLERNEDKVVNSPSARFKQMLEDDVICQWSIEVLSQRCGYSKDHMRRIFERDYSMKPQEYRNRIRKLLIADYLTSSHMSVKEISSLTGFQYESYLSKFFIKECGMSPTEYRRKYS